MKMCWMESGEGLCVICEKELLQRQRQINVKREMKRKRGLKRGREGKAEGEKPSGEALLDGSVQRGWGEGGGEEEKRGVWRRRKER